MKESLRERSGRCRLIFPAGRGRRLSSVLSAITAAMILLGPSATAQAPAKSQLFTEQELEQMTPKSPNPYLAFLPTTVQPDWAYWNSYMKIASDKRRAATGTPPTRLVSASELEPNDTPGTATPVPGFGSASDPAATLSGSFPDPPAPTAGPAPVEDDGAIPLATLFSLTPGTSKKISTILGDGPHGSGGSGLGDFDFYEIPSVVAGQTIVVDIDTVDFGFTFDSYVAIWDSAGTLLAINDDEVLGVIGDSFLVFEAPENDTYYVSVGSFDFFFCASFPLDPFDSSSGCGWWTEGPYDITIGLDNLDNDFFSVDLVAGDILGAFVRGAAVSVSLFDPSGELRIKSGQDASVVYPGISPLPGGGNGVLAYVIEETGTYAVRAAGFGAGTYGLHLLVFRPSLEDAGTPARQVLFLDFDGASINTSIFGSPGVKVLSPLTAFLGNWGLTGGDESDVIDAIVAATEENLKSDIDFPGGNNMDFNIEIQNSRDHPDPFGMPYVSRVIIGGTIAESGIATIGIAESIDVGNFATEESALVLLDSLSLPSGDPNSLNSFVRDPGASMIDIIGIGVGNIVAHEAGHFFGNFHTENFFTLPNIMDQGGNLPGTVGVGDDFIFGNGDDIDVDFGPDEYVPNEGFSGTEDTLNAIAFGLTTGQPDTVYVDMDAASNGWGTVSNPFNVLLDGVSAANPNATIRIIPSSGAETFTAGGELSSPMTLVNHIPANGKVTIGAEVL